MGIRAHAPVALGREFGQFRFEAARGVEQLFRPVTLQPVFQQSEVFRMVGIHRKGDLVGAEGAFDRHPAHLFRPGPAFRRSEHDHRPARAHAMAVAAGFVLDALNVGHHAVEGRGHGFVHQRRIVAFDVIRRPAAAAQELVQLLRLDARQQRRIGDLVAVEMQNR